MTNPSRLHALLIGIDAYPQGISSLRGCVNDIDAIQALLLGRMHVDPKMIRRLVAPGMVDPSRPGEPPSVAPTRAHILQAFAEITGTVEARAELSEGIKDHVLVYFSGHGTQLTLVTPEGHRFTSEAILPVDVITPEVPAGRYIFDWELSEQLRKLAHKAHVTMVLDCCSAAGMTRKAFQVRGSTARYHVVSQAIPTELKPPDCVTRGLGPSIASESHAAVVVAACLDDERAIESVEDAQWHGQFTRALVRALADVPDAELAELRWSRIWSEVQANIATHNPAQHPWVSSNLRSHVFGGPSELGDAGYAVTQIANSPRVRIHAGTRAGVGVGAEIAVYGPEPALLPPVGSEREAAARQATLRVTTVTEHGPEAEIIAGGASWSAGARGRMILAAPDDRLAVTVPADAVALAVAIGRSSLLAVADDRCRGDVVFERLPDRRWALTDDVYGLGKPSKPDKPAPPASDEQEPESTLPASDEQEPEPTLPSCDEQDIEAAVRLAEHYMRYIAPVWLARRCHDHPGALRVSLLDCNRLDGTMSAKDAQDPALPVLPAGQHAPFELRAGRADDDQGDRFCLRIENTLREPLFVTVLDCDSDGAVSLLADRVHVRGGARTTLWHPSGPGQPFRAVLGNDQARGVDRFVCIATTDRGARLDYLEVHATFASALTATRLVLLAQPPRAALPAYTATIVTAYLTSFPDRPDVPRSSRSLRGELGRGLAIVIGIDGYGGANDLKNAERDACAIGERLKADHGFTVYKLCGRKAKTKALGTLFARKLCLLARAYEQIVIYFAGHGGLMRINDGELRGMLVPSGADFNDPSTFLDMAIVRKACEQAAHEPYPAGRKRHVLLLLDCCAAGAVATRLVHGSYQVLCRERYKQLLDLRSVEVIGATSHDGVAIDFELMARRRDAFCDEHSPFANALLTALTCAGGDGRSHPVDHNHDGIFTARELYDYVKESVYQYTLGLSPELRQQPVHHTLDGHQGGDLVFAASKRRLALPSAEQLSARDNPYYGAAAYGDSDRDERLFFGRDDALARLDAHVEKHRLTVVTGPSRCGKSSLINAGLIRARRAAGWKIVRVQPGQQIPAPAKEGAPKRLIVVDPLESVCGLPESERAGFLVNLGRLAARRDDRCVVVVGTADIALLGKGAFDGDTPAWSEYPVPAMAEDELRAVVEGPADVSVLFFTQDRLPNGENQLLVDRLLDEVRDMPDALSLLSNTLHAMVSHCMQQGGRVLTWHDYEEVHGVRQAIVNRAESMFNAEPPEIQRALVRIFIRLTDVRDLNNKRRALRRDQIGAIEPSDAQLSMVLDRLNQVRLIVCAETIELAHNALFTDWSRITALVDPAKPLPSTRAALQLHSQLADAALIWTTTRAREREGPTRVRDLRTGTSATSPPVRTADLWGRGQLAQARAQLAEAPVGPLARLAEFVQPDRLIRRIQAHSPIALSNGERGFLHASAARQRNALALAGAVVIVLLIGTFAGLSIARTATAAERQKASLAELDAVRIAAGKGRQNPREIQSAVADALDAIHTEPGAIHDPALGAALLELAQANTSLPTRTLRDLGDDVRALNIRDDRVIAVVDGPNGGLDVIDGLLDGPRSTRPLIREDEPPPVMAISPGGSWIACAAQGEVRLWNVAAGRWQGTPIQLRDARPAPGELADEASIIAFSADEARIAVSFGATETGAIGVWDVARHARVGALHNLDGRGVLALDPNGAHAIAAAAQAGWQVVLFDVANGAAVPVDGFTAQRATTARFSPDGRWLAIGSTEGAGIWFIANGQAARVRPLDDLHGNVTALAFSRDGARLAGATLDGDAVIWLALASAPVDVSTRYLVGNKGPVDFLAFSGDTLVAAGQQTGALLWDLRAPLALALRHAGPVTSLAAPAGGDWLVTGAVDRLVRQWSTRTGDLRQRFSRARSGITVAAHDTWFAASGADRITETFDEQRGKLGQYTQQRSPIQAVSISPTGFVASASGDGTVAVFDRYGAEQRTIIHAGEKSGDDIPALAVTAVAWSADGQLATAGNDGDVKLWPTRSVLVKRDTEPSKTFHHRAKIHALAWSPNGRQLVSVGDGGTAMLWQVERGTGRPLVGHHDAVVVARFAPPDGAWIVTAGEDGTTRIWSRDGQPVRTYRGDGSPVRDAMFASGACGRLATTGDDGTLRLWSTTTGRELVRFAAHAGNAGEHVVFLDGGSRVASGGADGYVRIFPTCVGAVVRTLCEMRDRDRTDAAGVCPMLEEEPCCQLKEER
jgi:WD40 repeat protein